MSFEDIFNTQSFLISEGVVFLEIEDDTKKECLDILNCILNSLKRYKIDRELLFNTVTENLSDNDARLLETFCIQERLKTILKIAHIAGNYSCMKYLLWALLNTNVIWINFLLKNLVRSKYFSLVLDQEILTTDDKSSLKLSIINYLTRQFRITNRNFLKMMKLKNYLCLNTTEMSITLIDGDLSTTEKLKCLCQYYYPEQEIISRYFSWILS